MSENVFKESVMKICEEDDRYHPDAYYFVRDALDVTVRNIRKKEHDEHRHVTGKELLDGFREFVLQEFGPMAITVLAEWGIKRTEDVGSIVFNLVAAGRLGKTDKDSIDDFKEVYDFDEIFAKPFRPSAKKLEKRNGRTNRNGKRMKGNRR